MERLVRASAGDDVVAVVSDTQLNKLKQKAAVAKSYGAFLKSTDGMDVLYRGTTNGLADNIFMTDYIGHALEYADGLDDVEAVLIDIDDVMRFDDQTFDRLRADLRKRPAAYFLSLYKHADAKLHVTKEKINLVREALASETPYSELAQNYEVNDLLVPVMQAHAERHGKNIISFLGNDYAEHGGQMEFVVRDISRYPSLRDIWNAARAVGVK